MGDNTQMASSKEPHNEVKNHGVSTRDKVSDGEQDTDVPTNRETSENNRGTGMGRDISQNRRYYSHHHQGRRRNFRPKHYVPVKRCYVCGIVGHTSRNCFQSVNGIPKSPREVESEGNKSDEVPVESMTIQNDVISDCIKRIISLSGQTTHDATARLALIQLIDSRIEFHLKNFIALNQEEDQKDERRSESEETLDDTDKEVFVPSNDTSNSVMPRPKETVETTPPRTKQLMNDNEEAKEKAAEPDNLETPIATAWE